MCSKIFNMCSTYPKAALMAHDMADSAHWCTAALVRRWYHAVPCTTSSAPSAGCPRFPQWFGTLAILPEPQWKWMKMISETERNRAKLTKQTRNGKSVGTKNSKALSLAVTISVASMDFNQAAVTEALVTTPWSQVCILNSSELSKPLRSSKHL